MEGHKFVNPIITNWAIIFFDTIIAVMCLAVSNAIVKPGIPAGDSTSLYFGTIVFCYIVSSIWIKPLVNLPETRFYRIMERTFHKVLLTGLLTTACLFFNKDAVILRALTATFLLVFFIVLLFTRMAEHAYFKRHFSTISPNETSAMEIPGGLYHAGNRIAKRIFDILLSILLLLTIYPVAYIVIFIYSKIKHHGAVYSTLRLTGLNGIEFTCIKFSALGEDNIINSLPQLFCVLTGSMSIVGTKAYLSSDVKQDEESINENNHSYMGKPGLTGWTTSEGFQSHEEEKALDKWYIKNWSLGLDIFIILKGLCTLLFKRNKQ